jgi:hypothetical protein
VDSVIPRIELVVEDQDKPRESSSDEESPAVKSQTSKPKQQKGTKAQRETYNDFKKQIESADTEQLKVLNSEIEIAYGGNVITEDMRNELQDLASKRFDEIFIEVAFEQEEISEKTIKLKDKLILVADALTVETMGKGKKEVTFEMGAELSIAKIDSKAKNVTLEGQFENKNVKFMMPISDLSKLFMKDKDISVLPETITEAEPEIIDETTLDIVNLNEGNVKSFMGNPTLKRTAIDEAKNESSKDLLDQLRKLPKCND